MKNFEKLYTVLYNTGRSLALYQMTAVPTLTNEALLVLCHLTFVALTRATSNQLVTIFLLKKCVIIFVVYCKILNVLFLKT